MDMEPEVLSPGSLLFLEPKTSCCIIAMMGCKTSIDPAILKLGLSQTLLHHPRFSSKLLVINGVKRKWVKTQVDLDSHVIVPVVDTEMESPALFIEDYISHLTTIPIDFSKPLWELHILNLKTPEAEAVAIFRVHHSIGDGMSLISVLLACCRKSVDPGALPTLPTQKQTDDRENRHKIVWLLLAVWSVLRLISNTLVDLSLFMATILFMKDTKTPVKGLSGVEHNPKRIVHRTMSLDDIKLVKNAMDMTVNDVILGVTQAGLSRYLNRKYGEVDKSKSLPRNIRLRATVLVNIRKEAGIQRQIMLEEKHQAMAQTSRIGEQDEESLEDRKRILELVVLDTWLENIMEWSPSIAMPNRRVWVSACGIPIHAWSVGTFRNIAERWGDLIEVENTTLDPLNFELSCFLVETDWFYRIEEVIELQVAGNVFQVRVKEVDVPLILQGDGEGSVGRHQDVGDALSSTAVGLRQTWPELNTSENNSVLPKTHLSTSPI
ncbi:hypothetical protein V6N12_013435 [Hibiscus sabdariffa]|uniref:diacylglycerol O-acyltransferase n=1 Tax=Hibiscus sabdariffa TaxID=183260 RepID=A0ABR2D6I6_9ROSI